MRRRIALLLGPGLALAAAAPAAAADVNVVGLDAGTWDKPDVKIAVGDKVTWTFEPNQPHNVAATSPNWTHKTTTARPAPPTEFTFTAEGVYTYWCDIHQNTMQGTITVGSPPPPPPPPLSEQPFPNDSALTTGAFEVGGLDITEPRLRNVTAKRAGKQRVRVAFRVSEQSVVTVKLARGGKTVGTKRARASRRGRVTFGGLKAGRYRVRLRARDVAGNASSVRTARVTLR